MRGKGAGSAPFFVSGTLSGGQAAKPLAFSADLGCEWAACARLDEWAMPNLMTWVLLTVGMATLAATAVMALTPHEAPQPDDPVLVVTLPWGDDPADVVARAGGQAIGPVSAPLAVMASGASAAAFMASGAFAVLPAASLSLFCEG